MFLYAPASSILTPHRLTKGVILMNVQVHRPLLLGAQAIGFELRERLDEAHVIALTRAPFPDFPRGWKPEVALDYGTPLKGIHECGRDQEELIPGVLVFDCKYEQASCGGWWMPSERFYPYWLHPVLIMHDGKLPDGTKWRKLTSCEAVSCLAQNRWLGAIRYASKHCSSYCCEACVHRGQVYVSCGESRKGHHAAYVPIDRPQPTIEMVRCKQP
jgi:hypothetical protein